MRPCLPLCGLVGAALLVTLTGCGTEEQVERYQVDKPASGDAARRNPHSPHGMGGDMQSAAGPGAEPSETADATEQRVLGAIIPRGGQCWFFKMTGPVEEVAPHADGFTALVKSIRFGQGEGTTPTWDLPEGWRQDPARGMRLATIRPDPDKPAVELSVIPLPLRGDEDVEEYVLSNVIRWREQVGLPEIDAGRLDEETTTVELDGDTARIVDVEGMPASDGAHPMGVGFGGTD